MKIIMSYINAMQAENNPEQLQWITQAAKDLLENPYLLSVWAHVCMSYTNTIQSRSVELSLNQLNGWTQVRFY